MIVFDPARLAVKTVRVRIEDLDSQGQYTRSVNAAQGDAAQGTNAYRLRNRHAVLTRGDVLSTHTILSRGEGGVRLGCTVDNFGTDIEVLDVGRPCYSLVAALSGALELAGPSGKAEAQGARGLITSYLPGARLVTSDASTRLVIWLDAAKLDRTLQLRLGEPPRERLAFEPGVDWSSSQGRVVWRMIRHLWEELRDPNGLLSDPVARETFTDLFLQTALGRLSHNYTAQLERPAGAAAPRHLRRAEAFMHASADQPISMNDVAAAAGCGTATLYTAFRQFRDMTPLAALHCIRLQRVREALQTADDEVSTHSIARRFGFSNPSRFIASYGKQFGEHPNATRRRGTEWSSS
jgi:AraC-like DNA-binding protein